MRKFSIVMKDRKGNYINSDFTSLLQVIGFSKSAIGGPLWARLRMNSTNEDYAAELVNALRYPIEIYDVETGEKVWWGIVSEMRIPIGVGASFSIGLSLERLFNYVKIVYSYSPPGGGAAEYRETAWANDASSVTEYWRKEKIISSSASSDMAAASKRDTILAIGKVPTPKLDFSGLEFPEIDCIGYWETLSWVYYLHLAGVEANAAGGEEQDLGKIAGNTKIYQKIINNSGESWMAYNISIYASTFGTPTDNLIVQLCANNAGVPGTVLATATIPASEIESGTQKITKDFSTPVTFELATTYFLVVSRSGALSSVNHYKIGVDEGLSYTSGEMRLWNGSSWVTRVPDADLKFHLGGVYETSRQLTEVINESAQFDIGVEVTDASGLYSSQYRDGSRNAKEEAEELMITGTSGLVRYVGGVDEDLHVRIYAEPAEWIARSTASNIRMDKNGNIFGMVSNTPVPNCFCPVGVWCELVSRTPVVDAIQSTEDQFMFFIDSAEYNAEDDSYKPQPRASVSDIEQITGFGL